MRRCPDSVSSIFYPMDDQRFKCRCEPSSLYFRMQLTADHYSSHYFVLESAAEKQCCVCAESNLKKFKKKRFCTFKIQVQPMTCILFMYETVPVGHKEFESHSTALSMLTFGDQTLRGKNIWALTARRSEDSSCSMRSYILKMEDRLLNGIKDKQEAPEVDG